MVIQVVAGGSKLRHFFSLHFGPVYQIGQKDISPEIVVKNRANPYSWHLEGLSPMRILVFGFVLPLILIFVGGLITNLPKCHE